MQEITSDKTTVSKLQSIHALVLRKDRMRADQARIKAAKASLNATMPSRFTGAKQVKVRPAWNLRRDSMHEIENPLETVFDDTKITKSWFHPPPPPSVVDPTDSKHNLACKARHHTTTPLTISSYGSQSDEEGL